MEGGVSAGSRNQYDHRMPASLDEWSDQHWDRAFARQAAQVDSAKLLVTFTLAIAATMVATALQVKPPQGSLDLSASISLAAAFILAIAVILMDRVAWISREKILQTQADNSGWTPDQLLEYIRSSSRDAERENEVVISRIKHVAEYQLLMSGLAAVLAVISLFR